MAPGIDKQLAALTEYERTAQTIINIEPLMIPGLLQTYDYARHIMVAYGQTRGEAEQRAALRIGRQHVLTDTSPKQLVAIVGEYARDRSAYRRRR
ncbi:Scr1 family TA system antitoxin-like transcriptional regulator [Saccharopolyspora shandongensis]|uniref:Scr1 family TA system antitoxin-like transcriptional regulator n=1 Tax=Saccharopolyspora shandongensis TaxID=418495 RepID=UPI00340F5E88